MAAIASAAILGGGSLLSGLLGSSAASKAAKQQAAAMREANALEQKRYEQTRADLGGYRDTGGQGLEEYAALNGLRGPEAQAAAMARFRTDPGYEFALAEGNRSIEGSAAARGGTLNGGTLKALQRYGQGKADEQYGSYLSRFRDLASLGENAAAQTGNFSQASTARQAGDITGAGDARASGIVGGANAWTGAIGNGLQLYSYGKGKGYF